MALAGNIKEFGLADIFQIVSLQQKTGTLTVESEKGKVTVLLDKGFIVGADATSRPIEQRLEQSLVRSGTITKFQLRRATENQKKTLQPLWTVLAETGEIAPRALQNMLSQQIHETIYHLLRWTDGKYRFDPQKNVEYDQQLIAPINTEFLIMEGFRITDEWADLEKAIPSLQVVVRRSSELATDSSTDLSEAESKVYDLLTSERTVQDLIDMSQLGEFDTCQTVYDLMQKRLVEKVPSKKGKAPKVRRISVNFKDVFLKVATLLIGLGVLAGIGMGIRYLPENFVLLHKPHLRSLDEVQRLSAQSQLNTLAQYAALYVLEHGHLPDSLDALRQALPEVPRQMLHDPWGQPYTLLHTDQGQNLLRSIGRDGTPDTADDIQLIVVH
jgi:hypothetical protein